MEKRAEYTITSPGHRQFHLRLPIELFEWLKRTAAQNRRSMTAEMIMALEAWKDKDRKNE